MSAIRSIPRRFTHALPVWAIFGASALASVGAVVDGVELATSDAPKAASIATALATMILGAALAILISPAIAVVVAVTMAVAGAERPIVRRLWSLPLAITAFVVAQNVSEMSSRIGEAPRRQFAYEVIVLSFTAGIVVLAFLFRRGTRVARGLALALFVTTIALDLATPRSYYRDAHDLLAMLGIASLAVVAKPFHTRLARAGPRTPWKVLGAIVLALPLVAMGVNPIQTGWRAYAQNFGYYEPRFGRTLRRVVDFDRDGFSPIAWGGDCDDFDRTKNPHAHETGPGVDRNCNGVALSPTPTDAERGLAPLTNDDNDGSPDLPAGAIDRFLLITIDCLRFDALRADVMPRVSGLRQRGLAFDRLYAAGSRTELSLPLIQRGSRSGAPVAARLAERHGVSSSALLAFYDSSSAQKAIYLSGFQSGEMAPWKESLALSRWPAPYVTDFAISALDAPAGGPRYVWAHYIDAHDPYKAPIPDGIEAEVASIPFPSVRYLARLRFIDREIGRLVDALEGSGKGGGLARTAILITGDHGEGLGFHGIETHGVATYEPLIHVPGLLIAPGVEPGTYGGLASHRDIPATIAGAFGAVGKEADIEEFGRSWFRLRAEKSRATRTMHRFVVSWSDGEFTLHGFMAPQAAIVVATEDNGLLKLTKTFEDGVVELVDLVSDPNETRNIEPSRRADAARLERQLELYRDIDHYP